VAPTGRHVAVVTNRHLVAADAAHPWLAARRDVVQETPEPTGEPSDEPSSEPSDEPSDERSGEGSSALRDAPPAPTTAARFGLDHGPFHTWERTVTVRPAPSADAARQVEVVETVRYDLAIPFWRPLFAFALRRHLRRAPREDGRAPWWAPPAVLDARASTVLALLCLVGAAAGYLGTLITQTVTYAAEQFDADRSAQGALLASVRVGVLLSLAVVAVADRRGRRSVLIAAVIGSCLFTALGALAPGMVWLGATQTFARALSTVVALLVAIVAVEEMPAGSRAFALSVLTMTGGLGAGLCVANLLYVDLADGAWRVAFVLPLLAVYPCWRIGRRLPETERFTRHQHQVLAVDGHIAFVPDDPVLPDDPSPVLPSPTPDATPTPTPDATPTRTPTPAPAPTRPGFRWGRFALLGASGFLWSMFLAPAAQFLNEFLRTERGFSGALIAVFVLATNTPAGIGIVAGGRLADRHGRRRIGAIGIVGGVTFTVVSYLTFGWPLWVSSMVASIIGALAIPALAVYGPELFPTGQRGAANGGLQVVSVAGSGIGLLLVGWLGDVFDSLGPAIAVVAAGPAVLVVLVLALYPETAGRELEDLNPVDRLIPASPITASDGTLQRP
jgi:MFS family permease